MSTGVALRQRFKQGLGLLEVGRVKAFGEPVIHRGKQVMGFLAFPLLLPESSQARSSTEFERFGLLAASHVQSPLQPDFRLLRLWYRLSLEQDATETTNFRFPPAFVRLL